MSRESLSILPGTVAFLVLGALSRGGSMHGFEILSWIREASDGDFMIEEGALYPALHRIAKKGWIEGRWAISEKGRRARYYDITAAGRKELTRESASWERYVDAIARVMGGEPA